MSILFSYIAGIAVIFLSLVEYIIIFEIILSWLILLWIQVRIRFFSEITYPIYSFVKKYIPTTLGPLDLTPMIVILAIQVIVRLLLPFTFAV